MIIQNEREPNVASRQKAMESKKYLVVKNHVREVAEGAPNKCEISEEPSKNDERKRKKRKKAEKQTSSSDDNSSTRDTANEISESDVEELRRVYKKCKSVLLKIESKYGHLLNLDEDCVSKNWQLENTQQNECKCALNTKVIFNENGDIVQAVGSSHEHHICPDKLETFNRYSAVPKVQIETEHCSIKLPDTIQELENMLKEPLPASLRHDVIQKVKFIRQVNLNMIRFDRQNLMDKLKVNPDELLDFKGANLASIVGYPTKPL